MPRGADINPETGKAYAVNPATGVWDDNYWAQVVEPQLKQLYGPDPVQEMIENSINAYNSKLEEYNKKYNEFEQNNPFIFDKVLEQEKTKVAQRLDPYYEQTLSDYLQGVNTRKQRSLEDERTLLGELQQDTDRYTEDKKQIIDDTLEQSRQGFADAGLYASGQQLRAEGKIKTQGEKDLQETLLNRERKTRQVQTDTRRLGEDLSLEQSLRQRELKREQTYQTEQQALPEVERLRQQREFERGQFTGAAPGVEPLQYQNSLYSLLR